MITRVGVKTGSGFLLSRDDVAYKKIVKVHVHKTDFILTCY